MIKILFVFTSFSLCFSGFSQNNTNSNSFSKIPEDYLNKIVSAIYKIENSKKYPFGIKSVDTGGDYNKAKKICENTVRNNWGRFNKLDDNKYHCYLDFLASRYCPESCDPIGHKNWVNNIHKLVK